MPYQRKTTAAAILPHFTDELKIALIRLQTAASWGQQKSQKKLKPKT
jgi:hypothetical protein